MDAEMLQFLEAQYSGGPTRVPRRKVSQMDPRLRGGGVENIRGTMQSGARFIDGTGYGDVYAERLADFPDRRFVMVEMGTLLGVGLAVWCDVFPKARVIGLDVDILTLDMAALRERGAFELNSPALHFLDELHEDAGRRMERILRAERIDVFIDDALHDTPSILTAMAVMMPFMADQFLYFVEDNASCHKQIRNAYPELAVENFGRLTVVQRG